MTTCPQFTTITANTIFVMAENIDQLRPDVFERTVGTAVTVTCRSEYTLNGQGTFTCLASGQWSYPSVPTCVKDTVTVTPVDTGGVDDDTNILIGVVCGVAALIVIILVGILIAAWYRHRQRKRQYEDESYSMDSRLDNRRYRDRDEFYGRGSMPPPPYRSEESSSPYRSSRRNYDGNSQQSGPMYLPDPRPDYSRRQSRKKPKLDEEYERRGSRPYVRDWIRSSSSTRDYDSPSVHGRGAFRDSHLWRKSVY